MNDESRADGPYVITLCPLASAVSIRQPESPVLKQFTFFVAPIHSAAGTGQLGLHMGYFETVAQAQPWLQRVRGRYPNAIVTSGLSQATDAQVTDTQVTDTQVMRTLEARGTGAPQEDPASEALARIPLLRPEDTGERRVLKEAVVSQAPVQFAVQLDWSLEPIDPTRLRSLGVFNGLTVYVTTSDRGGLARHFLRVGFFGDPVAAKQMALRARATYGAAVVVPVTDAEVTRAHEPDTRPARRTAGANPKSRASTARAETKPTESLEQALRTLADHEKWANLESTGDSGVRHLRVDMEERKPKRS